MLDAMERNPKGNDNFAIKVISTENVEKRCKRSQNKESNLFPFQVINLGDFFKVTSSGKLLNFKNFVLECKKNDLFEQTISSSLRAIYKFILHAIQNV